MKRAIWAVSVLLLIMAVTLMISNNNKQVNESEDRDDSAREQFPIGLWVSPPVEELTMERYAEIKEAGINFVTGFGEWKGGTEAQLKSLDLAERNQLKVIIRDPELAQSVTDSNQIEQLIAPYIDHPAYMGHAFYDEPSSLQFEQLANLKQWYEEHSPEGLAYVNLFPTYASTDQKGGTSEQYIDQYLRIFKPKILSYDHYPFVNKTSEDESANITEDYFYNLSLIRKATLKHHVPFWLFIQTLSFNNTHRDPTEEEIKWQVFTSLVYGAKGIQYFTYWTPNHSSGETFGEAMIDREGKRTQRYDAVKRINEQIQVIGDQMMEWTSVDVVHIGHTPPLMEEKEQLDADLVEVLGDSAIIGHFEKDGKVGLLIVNGSYEQAATIQLKPKVKVKTMTLWQGGVVSTNKVEKDGIKIELSAGEGAWMEW